MRGRQGLGGAKSRMFEDPASGKVSSRFVTREYHGSCTTPVFVGKDGGHDNAERSVRCRRCPGCIRARRHLWRLRAEAETLVHRRTWFFTGTFARQSDFWVCDREATKCTDTGCVSHECTRFFKRLRRRSDRLNDNPDEPNLGALRYLLVYERHKSGKLHVHALIHTNGVLRYRDIKAAWHAGFMDAKLADLRAASYVTKYVTKSVIASDDGRVPRIRASRSPAYGSWVMNMDEDELQKMLSERPNESLGEVWEKNLKMVLNEMRNSGKRGPEMILREMAMKRQQS